MVSGGCSLAGVCGLLPAVASLLVELGLWAQVKSILPMGCNINKIKHLYGKAMGNDIPENQVIQIGNKEVVHRNIATVIEARLIDIAELVMKVVEESGLESQIVHGFVITGGTAALDLIAELFERETNHHCRRAETLYGIGKKPQDCEITPGQHAAVAIMMQAAQYSSSLVVEVENPVVEPETISVSAEESEPAAEVDTTPREDAVESQDEVKQAEKPQYSDKEKSDGEGTFKKFKRMWNISRWMGGDDKN